MNRVRLIYTIVKEYLSDGRGPELEYSTKYRRGSFSPPREGFNLLEGFEAGARGWAALFELGTLVEGEKKYAAIRVSDGRSTKLYTFLEGVDVSDAAIRLLKDSGAFRSESADFFRSYREG